MYLDLDLLANLVALDRHRHFGRASAHLNLSVSALSRRLSRLEAQVGARLVERGPGGFAQLTAAGDRVLARAEPLLRAARDLRHFAVDPATHVVRLGVPGAPSDHFPDWKWRLLARAFAEAVPGVRVAVTGVGFGECTTAVQAGQVDVMLAQVDPEQRGSTEVALMQAGRILVISSKHELAGRETVHAADLIDLPLLRETRATDAWFSPWMLGDIERHRPDRVRRISVNSFADVAAWLQTASAATITTEMMAPMVRPWMSAPLIVDVPRLQLRASYRTQDRRPGLRELLSLLQLFGTVLAGAEPAPDLETDETDE